MARIKNIELPGEKHICISLTAIYGIGRSLANKICDNAGVERSKKAKDLTNDEVTALRKEVDKEILRQNLARATEAFMDNKIMIKEFADVGLDFSTIAPIGFFSNRCFNISL